MPEVTAATPTTNGAARPSFREEQADRLREYIARLEVRRDELAAELAEVGAEIRTYQKSLAPLVDDDQPAPAYGRKTTAGPARAKPSRVGPERLVAIKAVILELAGDDDREFTQIEVRDRTDLHSSVTSGAFRQLRDEEHFIRLARKDGGTKYFRLTRPALREQQPATAPIRPPKEVTRQQILDAVRAVGRQRRSPRSPSVATSATSRSATASTRSRPRAS